MWGREAFVGVPSVDGVAPSPSRIAAGTAGGGEGAAVLDAVQRAACSDHGQADSTLKFILLLVVAVFDLGWEAEQAAQGGVVLWRWQAGRKHGATAERRGRNSMRVVGEAVEPRVRARTVQGKVHRIPKTRKP